ncbi:hypothetical protein JVU11DRAFT_10790 [Chiua virens]|nr:hypothetical protein JVU11DRAFT_10790 [Chiua virens]
MSRKVSSSKWVARKEFPWKALPCKLTRSAVVCYNFPDSVPFPGAPPHNKVGLKGISDLTIAECNILLATLNKSSTSHKMYFKHESQLYNDLKLSQLPVIIGAAPEHDSPNTIGRRIFSNNECRHDGLPRHKGPTPTHVRKKLPPCLPKAIANLSTKTTGLSTSNTINISDSDEVQIVSPPKVKNKIQTRHQSQHTTMTTKALVKMAVAKSETEVLDISSPSGSEYMPGNDEKDNQDALKGYLDNEGLLSDNPIAEPSGLGPSCKCK